MIKCGVYLVSVVIPACGRQNLLRRAINSVIAQKFINWELIVVDDASDPSLENVVKSFADKRINYVRSEKKIGGGGARHLAISMSKGDLIAFLDSDDLWDDCHLVDIANFHRRNGLDCISYCDVLIIKNKKIIKNKTKEIELSQCPIEYVVSGGLIQTSSIAISSAIAKKVQFAVELPRHQDIDFYLRCHAQGIKIFKRASLTSFWDFDHDQGSISRTPKYKASLDWIDSVKNLISNKTKIKFIYNFPFLEAIRARDFYTAKKIIADNNLYLEIIDIMFCWKFVRAILGGRQ